MSKVSSNKQNHRCMGRVFTGLLASAIGLFIMAATLTIVFTPTLSSKAMAVVTDTAPSSVYRGEALTQEGLVAVTDTAPSSVYRV